MSRIRRSTSLVVSLTSLSLSGACEPRASDRVLPPIPSAELRPAVNPAALLDSARRLMLADSNVALVSVDADGQPRVRTVKAFVDPVDPARPASGVTVWVMTRLTTRKVEQIRRHPQATLYFNDDARLSYATVMGVATVHTDPEHAGAKRHYDAEYARFFWPDFPRDFVMLEIRPRWLEYIGPGVSNDETTWRPQSVTFEPRR
jgi:general stress protein 26